MAPSSLACEARLLRFRHLVLLAVVATFCCSHVDAVKEELEYAILSDETGEMFHAKGLPVGMTTNSDDCILVHHTGCTSRARWRCVTCEAGDHLAADRFTSCHVKFEPVEGASLVRLTCQALNHMTEGVSTLVDTGYYPKHFPTALRKCTWPHERVPPLQAHRTKLCNDTQERYEGLQRERRLAGDDSTCSSNGCTNKPCSGAPGGTAGGCGCEGDCTPSCGCTCQDIGTSGNTNCQCVSTASSNGIKALSNNSPARCCKQNCYYSQTITCDGTRALACCWGPEGVKKDCSSCTAKDAGKPPAGFVCGCNNVFYRSTGVC